MQSTVVKNDSQDTGAVAIQIGQEDRAPLGSDPSAWPDLKDVAAAPFGSPEPDGRSRIVSDRELLDTPISPDILRSISAKSRGFGGSAPGTGEVETALANTQATPAGKARRSGASRLLDTTELTLPDSDAPDGENGREFVEERMRQYRRTSHRIASKLARSDIGAELKKDVDLISDCCEWGGVWNGVIDPETGEELHVGRIYSCHHRFCLVCVYKVSLRRRKKVTEIVALYPDDRWRFVTLTLPDGHVFWYDNEPSIVHDKELKRATRALHRKWDMDGWFLGVESPPNYDTQTFHPHIHMLVHFAGEIPAIDLYRRIWWRDDWRSPAYHDKRTGHWKIRREEAWLPVQGGVFKGRFEWVDEHATHLEEDGTFFAYVDEHPESIQNQWHNVSGHYIADIRRPSSPEEVVKYICKPLDFVKLPDDALASLLIASRGLRRWSVGGAFRELMREAPDSDTLAGEEEATGEGWKYAWSFPDGLQSLDEVVRALTEQAIEKCLWTSYSLADYKRMYSRREVRPPPWYFRGMYSSKAMRSPDT